MPDTARLLQFPNRASQAQSVEDVLASAREYLTLVDTEGAAERRQQLLGKPDLLLSLCTVLREQVETIPAGVSQEAIALYRCISGSDRPLGSFDERDFFLGEVALLAAMGCRLAGKRADTDLWLDRAEAGFRHTVNPAPLLANVTYQRLALRCEVGRYDEVVELAPMLSVSFAKLSMRAEQAKCLFLEAVALKQGGRYEDARTLFQTLSERPFSDRDPGLSGLALVTLADIHATEGRDDLAEAACAKALPLMRTAKRPAALAHLQSVVAEILRRQGRIQPAIEAYRLAIEGYSNLGMRTWVAFLQVILAQTMLEAGRPREAEWQIIAALPTIDEEKMVPEGFAAVALLRESVRLRKTDPKALGELREYLKAKN